MNRNVLLVAILGVGMAGCSSMNVQGDVPTDEPIYTTGSHLPTRSGGASSRR